MKNSKTSNQQKGIQKAINTCSKNIGGTVYFPPGDYLSSTIILKSDINIQLDAGATLWASKNKEHYRESSSLFLAD